MEAKEVNPAVGIVVVVVLLGIVGFFGFRAAQPAQPRTGSYTPGVPPWMEKKANAAVPAPAASAPGMPPSDQNGVHLPPADATKAGLPVPGKR